VTAPTALVTGASSGIGAAIAVRLAAAGWHVVGVSRRPGFRPSTPGLDAAAVMEWMPADLADPSAVASVAAELAGRRFDAVVHAAGLQITARVGDLDPAAGERMWAVHVRAPMAITDALVDAMPDGGRIVLIGSRTAGGAAGKSQYAATKAALVGLGRSWAMDLAGRRICVNVVAPGPTATEMTTDPRRVATPTAVPPFGRLIRADEVAQLVEFLLGPGGAMITGQQLVVCGGASLAG
jgi:NAD(P)-dependent dehydrogenase (short-subunit alcohol dehydrogenase family)